MQTSISVTHVIAVTVTTVPVQGSGGFVIGFEWLVAEGIGVQETPREQDALQWYFQAGILCKEQMSLVSVLNLTNVPGIYPATLATISFILEIALHDYLAPASFSIWFHGR